MNREFRALHDLYAQLFSIAHIIVEPFGTVMSEAVVIADDERCDTETFFEHLSHKLAGRKSCQLAREM